MHQMGTVGDMIHMPSLFTCGNHMTNLFKVNYMLCTTTETCGNHMFTCVSCFCFKGQMCSVVLRIRLLKKLTTLIGRSLCYVLGY